MFKAGPTGKNDPNCEVRPTGAYVEVNQRTQKEPPDNLRVETLTSDLGDSITWLETDALTAYRQVLLDEACRDLTTLWTPIGRLRSTRLCFGLTTGTALGARLTEMLSRLPPDVRRRLRNYADHDDFRAGATSHEFMWFQELH